MTTGVFQTGSLVRARGREWVVLPETRQDILKLRPLGGSDEDATVIYLPLERKPPETAVFGPPNPEKAGDWVASQMLRDAMMLKLRAGAGPFRGLGNICVEPRAYQLVPLMMALKLDVVRLLVADDVGIGKTIEAGLIVRELLDRGEVERLAVLCPPHLCDQWKEELFRKFNISCEVVRTGTASRLDRGLPAGKSLFEVYPFTVVSLDFIKSDNRRDEFQRACPECVIVEEAHTCVSHGKARHQRYRLLRALADEKNRHMIFLTATPHSGNDEAFYNLLGMLRSEFSGLGSLRGPEREQRRENLALHFVQRRRADIAEWRDTTLFPDRQTRENTYALTREWSSLFDDVLGYAREIVERAESLGKLQQRMSWWAALALLRCISSSPQAAGLALRTRIQNMTGETEEEQVKNLDALGEESVLDGDGEDLLMLSETVPGAVTDEALSENAEQQKLLSLAFRAEALRGPGKDPKLAALLDILDDMIASGFSPVVFCRYIATAHYLELHLRDHFQDKEMTIKAITGEMAPEEREEHVRSMGEGEKRVLVATDCLSEGINLQELFTAVIHYDLSWNPTRHEQREGRVDRFGQRAPVVRAVMLYGKDNPVDGAVLQVILRKAEKIRKELGVTVPLPMDTTQVMETVMRTVLFRKKKKTEDRQLALDLGEIDTQVDESWSSAKEKAEQSRTIFAQRRLKPDEVLPEWRKAIRALGGEEDVRRFIQAAAERLGAPLEKWKGGFRFHTDYLPGSLRERFDLAGYRGTIRISFSTPRHPAVEHLHRTHPFVVILADYIAERALAGDTPNTAARSGAMFTKEVKERTTLFLLRLRNQLSVKRRQKERIILAEECFIAAAKGTSTPVLLEEDQAEKLLSAVPSKNMAQPQRIRLIGEAIQMVKPLTPLLNELAGERAKDLLADHRRVRTASDATGLRYDVKPCLPVDVIGTYIFIPDVTF